jgi:hypothetical protein
MLAAGRAALHHTGATTLVSGGAAWGDAVAVSLFLEDPARLSLVLELPADLVPVPGSAGAFRFFENGKKGFVANPGGTLNYYHDPFNAEMVKTHPGFSSYLDFGKVVKHPRASVHVGSDGLHGRNRRVAQAADHMLAMTFGHGMVVNDGGTAYTMKRFLAKGGEGQAFHLDLGQLKLFKNARVADFSPPAGKAQDLAHAQEKAPPLPGFDGMHT